MKDLTGKKLLVLGGSASNVQLVHFAQEMGAYVIVADNQENRPGKKAANDSILISSDDYESLARYIKENSIDGVSTGAGEWNVINAMKLCKLAGLPYYANEELWNICQDKRNFKDCCKRYGVPVVPEYSIEHKPTEVDYPVIVKPVDGCSSRGISVCRNHEELEVAINDALSISNSTNVIIEKYVENGGVTIDAKYVAINGKYYLEAFGERYVLENGLITAISFYPSSYLNLFLKQVDPFIKQMFSALGYQNGAFFFQAIPDGDNIYIYEMGLRVSGGMIYNMTAAAGCNNVMKMLIHHSLTGEMCEDSDIATIDPLLNGKSATTLALPLKLGKIATIEGMDEVRKLEDIADITVYYSEGHECIQKHINTLDQLFARIMIVSETKDKLTELLLKIRDLVSVKDSKGNELINWTTFDRLVK